jgi:hypothetical protein
LGAKQLGCQTNNLGAKQTTWVPVFTYLQNATWVPVFTYLQGAVQKCNLGAGVHLFTMRGAKMLARSL